MTKPQSADTPETDQDIIARLTHELQAARTALIQERQQHDAQLKQCLEADIAQTTRILQESGALDDQTTQTARVARFLTHKLSEVSEARIAGVRAAQADATQKVQNMERTLAEARRQYQDAVLHFQESEHLRAQLVNSTSWKITAPLRAMIKVFRRF